MGKEMERRGFIQRRIVTSQVCLQTSRHAHTWYINAVSVFPGRVHVYLLMHICMKPACKCICMHIHMHVYLHAYLMSCLLHKWNFLLFSRIEFCLLNKMDSCLYILCIDTPEFQKSQSKIEINKDYLM